MCVEYKRDNMKDHKILKFDKCNQKTEAKYNLEACFWKFQQAGHL